MKYETAQALRMALEQWLLTRSRETGVALERLRRRVVFERVITRLQAAEPGRWVLKGGMALEVRLDDRARLTKDLDLGLRGEVAEGEALREQLVELLAVDPSDDRFVFAAGPVQRLLEDGAGHATWRTKIAAQLAGRPFGSLQLDVSPRVHELARTELVVLPNSLAFAGVPASEVEIIEVHRHGAEKLHGMVRVVRDRENTRVRDLVDLIILIEHDLLDSACLAVAVHDVWAERDAAQPPAVLPPLPTSWPERYERLATEHGLQTTAFVVASARLDALWSDMFPIANGTQDA